MMRQNGREFVIGVQVDRLRSSSLNRAGLTSLSALKKSGKFTQWEVVWIALQPGVLPQPVVDAWLAGLIRGLALVPAALLSRRKVSCSRWVKMAYNRLMNDDNRYLVLDAVSKASGQRPESFADALVSIEDTILFKQSV